MSWPGASLKTACVLAIVLAGGCGSGGGGTPSADGSTRVLGNITWTAPASGQPSMCSIVAGDTEVIVYAMLHDVSPACSALRHGLSSGGLHWSNGSLAAIGQTGLPIQFTIACALASSADDEQVTVVAPSSAGVEFGKQLCATFAGSGGWRASRSGTTTTLASAGY